MEIEEKKQTSSGEFITYEIGEGESIAFMRGFNGRTIVSGPAKIVVIKEGVDAD